MSSDHIVDAAVLLFFLLAGQEELLCRLVGPALRVPLSVYDPTDRNTPPSARLRTDLLSAMRQAVRHFEKPGNQHGGTDVLARVQRVDHLYDTGQFTVEEMTRAEQLLAAELHSIETAGSYGLDAPLGAGEAACVAIAHERQWEIATEDADALKALSRLDGNEARGYEGIQGLLIRAVDDGHISGDEASAIHTEMRAHGFWGATRSFA